MSSSSRLPEDFVSASAVHHNRFIEQYLREASTTSYYFVGFRLWLSRALVEVKRIQNASVRFPIEVADTFEPFSAETARPVARLVRALYKILFYQHKILQCEFIDDNSAVNCMFYMRDFMRRNYTETLLRAINDARVISHIENIGRAHLYNFFDEDDILINDSDRIFTLRVLQYFSRYIPGVSYFKENSFQKLLYMCIMRKKAIKIRGVEVSRTTSTSGSNEFSVTHAFDIEEAIKDPVGIEDDDNREVSLEVPQPLSSPPMTTAAAAAAVDVSTPPLGPAPSSRPPPPPPLSSRRRTQQSRYNLRSRRSHIVASPPY